MQGTEWVFPARRALDSPQSPAPAHRQLLLQADTERLGVVGFQLLQGHARLPDELVVAEFVLIAHGDPGGREARPALQTHAGAPTTCP